MISVFGLFVMSLLPSPPARRGWGGNSRRWFPDGDKMESWSPVAGGRWKIQKDDRSTSITS